jgi:ATP-dependent Lon protease
MPPSHKKKQYNFRNLKKKVAEPDSESSSSESESEYKSSSNSKSSSEDDEETVYTECNSADDEEGGEEFDQAAFRKTIAKMFPSKYSKERAGEKSSASNRKHKKHQESSDSESESEEDEEQERHKSSKKHKKRQESSDSESDSEEDEEPERRKSSKKHKHSKSKKVPTHRKRKTDSSQDSDDSERESNKINLILSVGGGLDDEFDEFDDEYDAESLIEDVTEEFDSDAEKTFMGEAYEQVVTDAKGKDRHASSGKKTASPKNKDAKNVAASKSKKDKDPGSKKHPATKDDKDPLPENVESEYKEMVDLKKNLILLLKTAPKNKIIQRSLDECNRAIKKLTRKARHENTNAYYKLVNSERRQTNEIDYFKHKLSNKEQQVIMADLKDINRHIYADKPYRLALLQSNIPAKFKTVAMQKLNTLKSMEPGDHEYYKIKNWVDAFMRIPFGVYRSIHIKRSDGIDVSDQFMEGARKTLNDCVYGLNDAKLQIMQMLGQWIVNPNSVGTAIAIHGPPGTGKTSIVKEGISKILGREFAFIALGGCGDGSFLEGHSYTYEGSSWGKIAQILMECKSMNPIIYFDELDKVSDTARGQEIIGILTHLTDTSQNSEFHDKYFSDVSLDLSKCLFIFSYNEEHLVNSILKDRMYRIQTKGYDSKEKITIARDYLLPKIREQVSFGEDEIIIPDDTLQYLISTPHLTKSESGVRNLKRCLEIIYTKLNLYRLVKPDNPMFEKDLGVKVEFPITITRKEVDSFIKNNDTVNASLLAMYV